MLHDVAVEPGAPSTDELQAAYGDEICRTADVVGMEPIVEVAGVSETVLPNGVLDLTLEQAAAILEFVDDNPDVDATIREFRDHLLMDTTSGVLDVDTLASEVDLGLSGQEIQQAVEDRTTATLNELAVIHRVIAVRNGR